MKATFNFGVFLKKKMFFLFLMNGEDAIYNPEKRCSFSICNIIFIIRVNNLWKIFDLVNERKKSEDNKHSDCCKTYWAASNFRANWPGKIWKLFSCARREEKQEKLYLFSIELDKTVSFVFEEIYLMTLFTTLVLLALWNHQLIQIYIIHYLFLGYKI